MGGEWHAAFRSAGLKFPEADYRPLSEALAARDAVESDTTAVPKGIPVVPTPAGSAARALTGRSRDLQAELVALAKAKAIPVEGVHPGRRVVLHVHTGPWQGWYTCRVLSSDPMGCYLEHEGDGFTENVPWAFLNGGKYSMELLSDDALKESPEPERTRDTPSCPASMGEEGRSTAADILRVGRLRVHSDTGAGLTLVACEFGYFVSRIDDMGQPDLQEGDAVVAIGDAMLLGLQEDEVERCFGESFHDGCAFVAGNYMALRRQPFAEIRLLAKQLNTSL